MLGRTCLALCVLAGLAGLARAEGALGLNVDTSSKLPARKLGIEFLDYDWLLNAAGGSDRSGKS